MAELRTRSSERLTPKITLVLQPNHHSDHNGKAFGHWNLSKDPMLQGPGVPSPVWTSGSGTHAPNAAAWRSALDSTGQSPWGFPSFLSASKLRLEPAEFQLRGGRLSPAPQSGTSGMPSTAKQPPTGSALPSVAGTPKLDLFDTSVARAYRNRIGSLHLRYRSSSSAAPLLQRSQHRLCLGNH